MPTGTRQEQISEEVRRTLMMRGLNYFTTDDVMVSGQDYGTQEHLHHLKKEAANVRLVLMTFNF